MCGPPCRQISPRPYLDEAVVSGALEPTPAAINPTESFAKFCGARTAGSPPVTDRLRSLVEIVGERCRAFHATSLSVDSPAVST